LKYLKGDIMKTQNYVYVIQYNGSISQLGFDSIEKAQQWLIDERDCTEINKWTYKNNGEHYYIMEIKIV